MLGWRRGTAEPAVIGNIDQQVGAIQHKPPDFVWKNRLVTNKGAEPASGDLSDRIARAAAEIAGEPGKILGEPEKIAPGNIFAKGNKVNLVILKLHAALRIEHGRAVMRRKPP